MKYYLCKFNEDDTEGFGVSGFKVLTENEKKSLIQRIKNRFDNDCILTLSNGEEVEFDDSDDALESIKFKKISEDEYWTIRRVFDNTGTFGEQGIMDEDNWEEEPETCSNCGCELEEWEHDLCESCEEEEQEEEDEEEEEREDYESDVKKMVDAIKKEFHLEATKSGGNTNFNWSPTPKSEIKIYIPGYEQLGKNASLSLHINNRNYTTSYMDVRTASISVLNRTLREFVKTAKEKFNG